MSPELTTQEQSIRSQVELSERALDGLEADLRSIDAELEALAEDHHKYDVLKRVCQNLEELDDLDAAELFWDGHGDERNRRIDHESRGSNFVLKLDDRTLPSGFRASTRPAQIQRATRGKALRMPAV